METRKRYAVAIASNIAYPDAETAACSRGLTFVVRVHSPSILYFDAVRKSGSIREAARRLNVASSAVNRQILKLEAEIGTPLFDRYPGGMRMTSAGEALARHVIVVLQDLERARSDIDELRGARSGHIVIAAVEGVCSNMLPNVITRLRERAPRVTVSVESKGSTAIASSVASGDADIGVAFALPRLPELRQVANARFQLGAIMAPSHPLATRSLVSVSACAEFPFVMASSDLSIHQLLAPAFARLGYSPSPSVQSNSVELMQEMAAHGGAIAFQTRIGAERRLAEGKLVHVPLDMDGPIWSDLGVYVRAGRCLSATLDLCLQLILGELSGRKAMEQTLA